MRTVGGDYAVSVIIARVCVTKKLWLDTVAELVGCGLQVRAIGSLVPGQVKQMTYKIYALCFPAWRSALIG